MRYREQAYELTVPISQKAHLLNLEEISEKFGAALWSSSGGRGY
jgi:hypothetical protein